MLQEEEEVQDGVRGLRNHNNLRELLLLQEEEVGGGVWDFQAVRPFEEVEEVEEGVQLQAVLGPFEEVEEGVKAHHPPLEDLEEEAVEVHHLEEKVEGVTEGLLHPAEVQICDLHLQEEAGGEHAGVEHDQHRSAARIQHGYLKALIPTRA
jgi:hypothetical protein